LTKEVLELCGDRFDEVGPSFAKIVGIEFFGCSVFESLDDRCGLERELVAVPRLFDS
jgi:hypothetical protein